MKKTFRKKTHLVKQKSRKSRKMKGGLKYTKKNGYDEVRFTSAEEKKIKKYYNEKNDEYISSTKIRDELFPNIQENYKKNAAQKIQEVLGRAYMGH